jgi:hypothetical protein
MRDERLTFQDREDAIETWLRTEVVAAYDELRADPSRAIPSDEIRSRLTELCDPQLDEDDS